jgi:RND family efflux transporter MFP subunit
VTRPGAKLRLLAAAVALVASVGCGSEARVDDGAKQRRPTLAAMAAPEPVSTTRVRSGEVRAVITATGSVVARRTTALGPAVAGRVIHIFVDLGDDALFGAPLFQIDPGPYAIALREAEAGLALARAEARDARLEAARTRKLAAKAMTSDQNYEHARTRAAVAEARVEQAEAGVQGARLNLNRTLVLAPFTGSVVERRTDEGTMASVTPNTVVVVLQESGALEASLDVPEASLVPVQPGDPVRLYVEGIPEGIESQVRTVSNRIDWDSRTYSVRVPIDDAERAIKAGAFVRADIEPAPRGQTLLVDPAAVVREDGATFMFRVSDGIAERVPVRLGVVGRSAIEILDGVEAGDEVVTGDATTRLASGTRVELLERPGPGKKLPAVAAGEGPADGKQP